MSPTPIRPLEPSLFVGGDRCVLVGSRCADCSTVVFPRADSCPRCTSSDTDPVELPTTGSLWSWTVQHFEPKAPYRAPAGGFVPFGVGYVDLGEVLVESILTIDPANVRIGMDVEVMWHDIAGPDDPGPVHTFAFGAVR